MLTMLIKIVVWYFAVAFPLSVATGTWLWYRDRDSEV